MENEGVHEEGWRVKGCMRRGAQGGEESEGVHEEGWRVKGCMRGVESEGIDEERWRVKHSGRSSCKLFFPMIKNCCYDIVLDNVSDKAGGLDC